MTKIGDIPKKSEHCTVFNADDCVDLLQICGVLTCDMHGKRRSATRQHANQHHASHYHERKRGTTIKRWNCGKLTFLRDNNCQSRLSLFNYFWAVWVQCCERPNHDFCISQFKWSEVGQTVVVYVKFLRNVARQTLLKLASVLRNY